MIPKRNLHVSVNTFIPKPHTPFQWAEKKSENYSKSVRNLLRKKLPDIKFSRKSPAQETIQSLISNGNETTGLAVLDYVRQDISLKDALRKRGISPSEVLSEKPLNHEFPWDCFSLPSEKEHLLKIWRKIKNIGKD